MRSARSASRLLVERLCWCPRWWGPFGCPRCPSLIAVVERADREVAVLVGVPLFGYLVSVGRPGRWGILTASRTACLAAMAAGGGRQGLDAMGATWWQAVVRLFSVPFHDVQRASPA